MGAAGEGVTFALSRYPSRSYRQGPRLRVGWVSQVGYTPRGPWNHRTHILPYFYKKCSIFFFPLKSMSYVRYLGIPIYIVNEINELQRERV